MKKKILSLVLSILLTVSIFPIGILCASAENDESLVYGTCGENLQWAFDGAYMEISKIDENLDSGDMYDYNTTDNISPIPHSANNIVIKEGVTSIGDYAFYQFSDLRMITIPNTVKKIGFCAFNGCTSLTEITIPGSVEKIPGSKGIERETATGTETDIIHGSLFGGCENLKDITIEEGVQVIEAYSLTNCHNLLTLTIPKSAVIEKIEDIRGTHYAFENYSYGLGSDYLIVYGYSNAKEYIDEMRSYNINCFFESQKNSEDRQLLFMKMAGLVDAVTDNPFYAPKFLKSDFTTNLIVKMSRSKILALMWFIPTKSFFLTIAYMLETIERNRDKD